MPKPIERVIRSMRYAALALSMLVGLIALAMPRAASAASQRLRSVSAHLYVADGSKKAVYRFPIGQDGLPATQPDSMISWAFNEPAGIAIDHAGNVYVADVAANAVYEFKANAFNADAFMVTRPIQTLNVSFPQAIAVDSHGYLYVETLETNAVNVYAPHAHGNDPPLHTMPMGNLFIRAVLVDSNDRLFVMVISRVYAFFSPLTNWTKPTLLFSADRYENVFLSTMGLDETENALLVEFAPDIENREYAAADFGRRTLNPLTSARPKEPKILTKECRGSSRGPGDAEGALISGNYFMFGCNEANAAVLVYPAHKYGRLQLVERVGEGILLSPLDVKLGP